MAKLSRVPVQLELMLQLAPVPVVQVDQLPLVEQGREESVKKNDFYHPCKKSSNLSQVSGYASDNLDEPEGGDTAGDAMDVDGEDEENTVSTRKRKRTKAAEAKLKAKEKKKKGSDDDDEDEDAYTALSKSLWSNVSSKPPVGSFENCAVCKKQFTAVC